MYLWVTKLCELVFLSPFVTCVQGDAGQSGTYTLHRLFPETHIQTSVNFFVCVTYGNGMVLLWRRYIMYFRFSGWRYWRHTFPYWARRRRHTSGVSSEWPTKGQHRLRDRMGPRQSLMSAVALFFLALCLRAEQKLERPCLLNVSWMMSQRKYLI